MNERFIKDPAAQPPRLSNHNAALLGITAAALVIAGIAIPTALDMRGNAAVLVFILCVIAAFVPATFLFVRLSWNATLFGPDDSEYQPEWLEVSEERLSFCEKEQCKGFLYDEGCLRWEDMTWIRMNLVYNKKKGRRTVREIFLYVRSKRLPASYLSRAQGDPDVQCIRMEGYPEEVAELIRKCAAGKVKIKER